MRHRVEAIIKIEGGYLVERLLSTEQPQNIGKLRCPGGAIEEDETPEDALIRELMEEYSIPLERYQLDPDSVFNGPRGQIHRFKIKAGDVKVPVGTKSAEGIEELVRSPDLPYPWL